MADHAGRLYTDIDVTLNRVTQELTVTSIHNVPTFHAAMAPAADLRALIDKYDALSAPLANAPIGTIMLEVSRTPNAAGESALGDVIADAQLWATASSETGGAVVALVNPGGMRADLPFASSRAGEGDGVVTFGEAFTVQPFGNSLVTMTLSGAQLYALLEQQWDNPALGQSRILQVSGSFTYAWGSEAATGAKLVPGSVAIGGVPIEMGTDYRVTVNSFLADGGDQFTVLRDGAKRLGSQLDLDALGAYFKTFSPVAPGRQKRITRVP
jgi:5'-nucleotidase